MEKHNHNSEFKDRDSKHNHDISESSSFKIILTIILNLFIGIVEVLGGLFSGSVSLISDALHNFSDAFAIIITYIAIKLSRVSENESFTFGFKRGEIIAAFINSSVLIVIGIFLIWEAFLRFIDPTHIRGSVMFFVALFGLIANIASVLLLKKDSGKNINLKSAYLHLLSDAITSLSVVIGAIFIYYFKIFYIDSILTILISLYIMKESFHIFKESVVILMMGKPQSISLAELKADLERFEEVINVHHAHIWMLTDKLIHFEAHIDVGKTDICELNNVISKIENLLKDKYGISHTTLQLESSKCQSKKLIKQTCHD